MPRPAACQGENEMVAQWMRRSRFDDIMKYFHDADNHSLLTEDKFAKVSPFLEILHKNFLKYSSAFNPGNVSIDESVVPIFDRHPSK